MIDEILADMSKDLAVYKFIGESEKQFIDRIIYSAMACWIKSSTLYHPLPDGQEKIVGVSRKHIFDKCNGILSELLLRMPESREYFQVENEKETAITIIRDRLIRSEDICNIGFNTDLILHGESQTAIGKSLQRIRGCLIKTGCFYSGTAMLRQCEIQGETQPPDMESVVEWFENYTKRAWWKVMSANDEDIEYFNPCISSANNFENWQKKKPESIGGYTFSRREVNKNMYEYMLQKEDGISYFHGIDSLLVETKEHRRFMLAMRCMAQNPLPAQVIKHKEYIVFKLNALLPEKESSLLETYAWPIDKITNKLRWMMSEPVWQYIYPYLAKLGLNISEVTNG